MGGLGKSIFVSGQDVYVAGVQSLINENNPAGIEVATYWKNGIAFNLGSETQQSYADYIVV